MTAPGLSVPRARGEEVRQELLDAGILRVDFEILREGDHLVFPLSGEPSSLPSGWGDVVQREFPRHERKGPMQYRDLLAWDDRLKDALPRAFDVVGDIVLLRLPPELDDRKGEVGDALLRFVPGARIVGLDHGVHGPERRRTVERIAGTGGWRTRHRENGLEIEVDIERAYFSPRLAREHARVAEATRPGEAVYDLCCGVGPFSLTIARAGRAARVTAVDSNPEAVALLAESLARTMHGERVTPLATSLEAFLPSASPVERVVMNLPHEGIKYLASVARTVAPGGSLHHYEVVSRTELSSRGNALVNLLAPEGRFVVQEQHVVHPYSPSADLVAFDLERAR